MGRCLFGTGIGHVVAVFMLSSERVGPRGCGEEDRRIMVVDMLEKGRLLGIGFGDHRGRAGVGVGGSGSGSG